MLLPLRLNLDWDGEPIVPPVPFIKIPPKVKKEEEPVYAVPKIIINDTSWRKEIEKIKQDDEEVLLIINTFLKVNK